MARNEEQPQRRESPGRVRRVITPSPRDTVSGSHMPREQGTSIPDRTLAQRRVGDLQRRIVGGVLQDTGPEEVTWSNYTRAGEILERAAAVGEQVSSTDGSVSLFDTANAPSGLVRRADVVRREPEVKASEQTTELHVVDGSDAWFQPTVEPSRKPVGKEDPRVPVNGKDEVIWRAPQPGAGITEAEARALYCLDEQLGTSVTSPTDTDTLLAQYGMQEPPSTPSSPHTGRTEHPDIEE